MEAPEDVRKEVAALQLEGGLVYRDLKINSTQRELDFCTTELKRHIQLCGHLADQLEGECALVISELCRDMHDLFERIQRHHDCCNRGYKKRKLCDWPLKLACKILRSKC